MRGYGLKLHRARRAAGDRGRMSAANKEQVVKAYMRLQSVRGAAKEQGVHYNTAKKWIDIWQRFGTFESPTRSNSGRPKTATQPSVVRQVVAEMAAPGDGDYVYPSAG